MATRPGWYQVLYNPNQKAYGYYNDKGVFRIIGGATLPGTDPNTYPLKMPAVAPGAPVNIGTGPDKIELLVSGNPASAAAGNPVFDVILDGKLIADDLVVTDFTGQGAGQHFTLNGTWGAPPHTVTTQPSLTSPGLKDAWLTAVQYDGLPTYYNGPNPNARDHTALVNATSVWDNENWSLAWTTTKAAEPPPVVVPPAPTLSIISGAAIDGAATAPGTLAELLARTPTGSKLTLPAGTFIGTGPAGAITVEGAGIGKTILDATGLPLYNGKAIIVPISTVGTFTARGITFRGARSPDLNGAGIRQDAGDINFDVEFCEFTDCDDGLLTFGGLINVSDSDFHDCGAGDQHSHNMYFGNGALPLSVVNLLRVRSVCGLKSTHALKSRFGTTNIRDSQFIGSSDPTGAVGGSVIDIPNGGFLSVKNSSITMGQNPGEKELIGYSLEGGGNGDAGVSLEGVPVKINSDVGYIHSGSATASLAIGAGCTYPTGTPAPTLNGWGVGKVTGSFSPA